MPVAASLAALVMISAAASGTQTPPLQKPGFAEAFSVAAGHALGAAAACKDIADARINRDAGDIGEAIERLARDPAERNAANHALLRAVGEGGAAIDRGAADCAGAAMALDEIEQRLSR